MKKIILFILIAALSGFAVENPVDSFNEQEKYGTLSGRIRSLSMYRGYEGDYNGFSSSMGVVLNYLSPEMGNFDFGLGYNYAWSLYENNEADRLANDDINVLNEAWMRYRVTTNTAVIVGRKITSGEVFRTDDFRQKANSIEAVQVEMNEIEDLKVRVGHAIRMSHWIQAGDRADFNDFGDVFGVAEDTDGVTWAEAVYTGIAGLEVALYDAYAHDVANLIGTRVELGVTDEATLVGYYRHENEVGSFAEYNSDVFGLSLRQKFKDITLEPGWFSVHGGDMQFDEVTTGINHPLGASMMIYANQFAGGSDTAYLKATTKLGDTKLYALYNYTWHDKQPYDAQELNVVVTQPITDALSVAVKIGCGYRDQDNGGDTFASDSRLFITYNF